MIDVAIVKFKKFGMKDASFFRVPHNKSGDEVFEKFCEGVDKPEDWECETVTLDEWYMKEEAWSDRDKR